MSKFVFILPALVFFSISCSTSSGVRPRSTNLTLSLVEQLKVNQSGALDANEKFGSPDMKVALENSQTAWVYLEGETPTTRLSLIFDDKTQRLAVVNWYVRESDSESDVERAKNRYPQARFVESSPEWVNSHSGPDELLYSDSKNNLEIVFQKSAKKVSAIRWESSASQLNRKPSSKTKF